MQDLIQQMSGLRTDRLATLYWFRLLQLLNSKKPRIPILMYHSVSERGSRPNHPYYETVTTPRVFEEHVRFLHENKYKALSLTDAAARVFGLGNDAEKAVVITFDDGFRDVYTKALPILSRYGYIATVFLPTAYIGHKFNDIECLTWSEVRELRKSGIQFGSHTVTHPQLRTLKPKDIEEEVRCSKQRIEEHLGYPAKSFAYPYAFPETDRAFTSNLRRTLEESGYETGVCTIIGTTDRTSDRYFMKRLPMNSWDDRPLFQAKLEGGYDWLHTFQYAAKLLPLHRLPKIRGTFDLKHD
jgi:peptidoglycan/xylan/chitin deacetylase (PgdA/CDA1 family)